MSKTEKNLIILAIIIVAASGAIYWFYPLGALIVPPAESALDIFAKCLEVKKATMYGADWCSHCQNEKKVFGKSFKFINYVECPQNSKQCLNDGIESYPTWILGNGKKLVGEQGLEKLSRESGCPF